MVYDDCNKTLCVPLIVEVQSSSLSSAESLFQARGTETSNRNTVSPILLDLSATRQSHRSPTQNEDRALECWQRWSRDPRYTPPYVTT